MVKQVLLHEARFGQNRDAIFVQYYCPYESLRGK